MSATTMSPRLRGELLAHEDVVAAEDAGLDHRVAGDAEAEHLAPAAARRPRSIAHRVDDVLLGEERQARRDPAERPERSSTMSSSWSFAGASSPAVHERAVWRSAPPP